MDLCIKFDFIFVILLRGSFSFPEAIQNLHLKFSNTISTTNVALKSQQSVLCYFQALHSKYRTSFSCDIWGDPFAIFDPWHKQKNEGLFNRIKSSFLFWKERVSLPFVQCSIELKESKVLIFWGLLCLKEAKSRELDIDQVTLQVFK